MNIRSGSLILYFQMARQLVLKWEIIRDWAAAMLVFFLLDIAAGIIDGESLN